ncbi:disease resistance protein TAO1 isoform X2 [Eutrema salsugineum]|uniref:disease resistance protein TAO1 isoform X2 n=1 Tax=Eutrema salsugineum TaxID=72664 RepID=UPI000CED7DA8|nr:disease resistance protein TAO1 isoform X2 [Eutrema salsugineum]
MALSALPRHFKHHVFPSFHGEDVRRGLLSYLLKEFREKVIDVFIDNDIERSKPIGPELKEAIKGSMIAIVLISRNYASSTWCLDELVEIMKCREEFAQTVMVVFHEVEPSDVKKQNGYFGSVFAKTCEGKKPEAVERWKQALQEVAKIAGYHSLKFDSDSDMIETIATDVSDKLNDSTAANDSDSLVGIGTHTMKMNSLLSLKLDEVRMVGIWGPAGIGKTTIARALYRKLSSNFTHTAFIESIKGKFEQNYRDEHAFMLHLQEQLLSKTLNQKDLRIGHLGVAKARLKNKKVLVVLDDVDDLKQLEAMTDKACWFGPGSRIIITTKDNKILKAHEINHIYQVGFPSTSEALEILCLSAFRHKSPPSGFEDMALEVTRLAGNLPLGLRVFGAYLRGMSKDQWIHALPRLRTSLDGDIEKVLRFSYDALCDEDQDLFLHIACFFRGGCIRDVVEYLAESRFNVIHGLQVLVDKCFISIYGNGYFMIHNLLEQLGKDIVRRQSVFKPGKRQFLVDVRDIRNVLEENEGTKTIRGIDFDLSEVSEEIMIDERAFEEMSRLQFLRFKKRGLYNNAKLVLPKGLKLRAQQA